MTDLKIPCLINPKRNGVAVVVWCGDKILTSKRIACRDMNNTWQWPGGAIEDGESAYDAAIRELKEETGLVALRLTPIAIGVGPTDSGEPHVTQFFLGNMSGKQSPKNTEPERHSDWEWVTVEEFLSRNIIQLTRIIANEFLLKKGSNES